VTSVAFDLPFVSSRPDPASRPTGTGGDFAALVDDIGTEPAAVPSVQARSEDQPKPAETPPAASVSGAVTASAVESRTSNPASSSSAPATGEIAAASGTTIFALVAAAPELQGDASGSTAQGPQPNAQISTETAQAGAADAILDGAALNEAAADGTDAKTPDNADAGIVTGPQVMSETVPAAQAITSFLLTPVTAPNAGSVDASATAPAQAAPDIAPAAPGTVPAGPEMARPVSGMADAMSAAAAADTPSATSPLPTADESVASAAQSSEPKPAKPAELTPTSNGPADQPKSATQANAKAMQASTQADPAHSQTESSAPDLQQALTARLDQSDTLAKPAFDASLSNFLAPTGTTALHATAHAATTQAAVSATQTVPVEAIAVEIASQASAGKSRFEIRLDPPELGRIDVRLDIDRDGNVTSRLVIERSDTYDLLRRDQSTLERALQQAGLKTSDNALEFSLRDQGFAQQRDADHRHGGSARIHDADIAPSEAVNGYVRLLGLRGGIDIRV
jgi:flagellar hook-length control protein FliK